MNHLSDRPITSSVDASTNDLPFHPHEDSPFVESRSGSRDSQHDQQDADRNATAFEPGLVKRGGCFSRQVGDSEEFECDGQVPDTATLRQKILDYRQIPSYRSVFYTNLGSVGGMVTARRWICAHPQDIPPINGGPGYTMFDHIVDERWLTAQGVTLRTLGNISAFQKLLLQAFAEVSAGRVYIFMLSDQEVQAGST